MLRRSSLKNELKYDAFARLIAVLNLFHIALKPSHFSFVLTLDASFFFIWSRSLNINFFRSGVSQGDFELWPFSADKAHGNHKYIGTYSSKQSKLHMH